MASGSVISARQSHWRPAARAASTSVTVSSASAMASAAGCISGQWNGALTGSSMPRLAPRALADLDRALDGGLVAADHDLAAAIVVGDARRPRLAAASLQASCAGSSSMPSSAAIAPSPTGTAFCIAWPRSFSSRAASASCRAPAAARAEYSPSEWPATMARQAGERLAAVLLQHAHDGDADAPSAPAGRSRSGSGRVRALRASASTDSASAPRRPPGRRRGRWKGPGQVAPMPTAWDPCPGKTKARLMSRFP